MIRASRLNIRRRLGALVFLASALAMACVALAVVFYDATSYRPRAIEEIERQGAILSEILRPALDFADVEAAERYLRTYRLAQPEIAIAAAYDGSGRFFSGDGGEGAQQIPAAVGTEGVRLDGNALSLWLPVQRNQQVLGYLYLYEDLPPLYARLPQYGIMAGAVVLALIVVGAVLFGGARRYVITPMSALVETTGRITREEDYSVRAPVAYEDEFGQLARSFNSMIEVVGRREAALRETEERMRRLASATFEGIVFTERGRVLEVNEQAARMWGYTSAELVGFPALDLVAPEARAHVQSIIAEGFIGSYEAVALRKDGSRFHFEARARELFYEGRPARVVALRDVTERAQAEAERTRLEEQLQQAQKMEAVGRLAGGVAHDFNNMLTIILGHVELALERVDPASPLHAGLKQVERAGQHSAELTRQLLAFARRQPVTPKVLDLNLTVSGTLTMLQRLIGEDINLAWLPGHHPGRVKIDPTQVDQILANLCVNARDAIAGVGRVTIETRTATFDAGYCAKHPDHLPGSFIMLSVADNGCGMDGATLRHVFEPFFTTKSLGEGTGLGLATVFGIVQQNDGFITVQSQPGAGTTFRIYLPRVEGKESDDLRVRRAGPPRSQGETVLLVEDEPGILALEREMLRTLGYTVFTAGAPRDAIRFVESHTEQIDLLITDVIMPEMNGRDLASSLAGLRPDIKCLFVSGHTSSVITTRGVLDEGVTFLQKPFSVFDLASRIREALESQPSMTD